jgi:hypothetical protein
VGTGGGGVVVRGSPAGGYPPAIEKKVVPLSSSHPLRKRSHHPLVSITS